jgi:hypothetical protein
MNRSIGVLLASVAMAVTISVLWLSYSDWKNAFEHKLLITIFFCGWTIGAPLWFFVEWWLWGPRAADTHAFEEFKYSQKLAGAMWIAIAAVLALLIKGSP